MKTRIVILADDGRYVTMSGHAEPSESEIADAASQLIAQGIGGWLAVMHGNPYAKRAPRLARLRDLAPPRQSWETAVAAFASARTAYLASLTKES